MVDDSFRNPSHHHYGMILVKHLEKAICNGHRVQSFSNVLEPGKVTRIFKEVPMCIYHFSAIGPSRIELCVGVSMRPVGLKA